LLVAWQMVGWALVVLLVLWLLTPTADDRG
jgi:hypothetical protein